MLMAMLTSTVVLIVAAGLSASRTFRVTQRPYQLSLRDSTLVLVHVKAPCKCMARPHTNLAFWPGFVAYGDDMFFLGIELWPVAIFFGGVTAVCAVGPLYRRRRRRKRGECVGCGYNLKGNVSGRCAECGSMIPQQR